MKLLRTHSHLIKTFLILLIGLFFLILSLLIIWVSTFKLPTLESIQERRVVESTKIYDQTGEILLYDTGGNVRRSIIPLEEISRHVKNATIAIEDREFYSHNGIKISAFIRAMLVNLTSLSFSQGGSTITQQVVKNSLLTGDKSLLGGPARKIKEWVLAIKLEKVMSKEEILGMYLNEIPYGGVLYGVEEASQTFFGKKSSEVTLVEAAYLAAIPKAPTFYSPYGKNQEKLEERKNLVLYEMLQNNFITEQEYEEAKKEEVNFVVKGDQSIKAPHFVFYVLDYIKEKYGEEVTTTGGLRITTSLDYDLQSIAEKIALDYALSNKDKFNAENASMIAIDPRDGRILTMVGSRDYFDKEIDGAFNVTTSKRQPGSTFKPFVYAEALKKGFTSETVVFDLKTQFSTNCPIDNMTIGNGCYAPDNYDNNFRGPVTFREALAQSLNVPSVKVLYLAGISDSIRLARDMGIESLSNKGDYGLTLVLGGGEVTPLEITSAYGVFANEGVKTSISPIIEIKDKNGNVLEKTIPQRVQVLDREVALKISNILSDNVARAPAFGQTSALYFANRDVAVKTGTTNDYRDAWIIGYTPSIAVGAWAGNNNNSPMEKKVAGFIVAPMWRAFMDRVLAKTASESFEAPLEEDPSILKPVLKGIWQGGIVASSSNNIFFRNTSASSTNIQSNISVSGGIHSILYWVDKNDPRGLSPENQSKDPQFERWEYPVQNWSREKGYRGDEIFNINQN